MIKLDVNIQEVDLILTGLLEIQAKFSMDLINKIRAQAIPQVQAQEVQEGESQE